MNDAARLARLRALYPGNAHLANVPFLLALVDQFKAVLGNMIAEYDKQPAPKPEFEAYVLEHARWLVGPRVNTYDAESLEHLFNVPPQV